MGLGIFILSAPGISRTKALWWSCPCFEQSRRHFNSLANDDRFGQREEEHVLMACRWRYWPVRGEFSWMLVAIDVSFVKYTFWELISVHEEVGS